MNIVAFQRSACWNLCAIVRDLLRYLLDSRWSDRRETLHVHRVGREHENSQGPMSRLHFANLSYTQK